MTTSNELQPYDRFDFKNSVAYLRYLIVPVEGVHRILNPDDGQLLTVECDSLEEAKKIVESCYVGDLMMDLLQSARDKGTITQEQLEVLVWMVGTDYEPRMYDYVPGKWLNAHTVAEEFHISTEFLHTLRLRGQLKQNIHWRALNFGSKMTYYQYNLPACAEVFVIKQSDEKLQNSLNLNEKQTSDVH